VDSSSGAEGNNAVSPPVLLPTWEKQKGVSRMHLDRAVS
jgi:hypothetical protein